MVREVVAPGWDIHPEMVTHTRVIDLATGHPYPHIGPQWQENWRWTDGRSVDELAEYLAYALQILKDVDLQCEGVTTPGGFGNRVLPELAQATLASVRDVFRAPVPHYFRHLYSEGDRSVAPRVEYAAGLESDDPKCVISIISCTGDWTGGWDCSTTPELDRFITPDLSSGRMVEVIERGEPAIIVCHWTGVYFNGEELGFQAFQEIVRRLHDRYDHLAWMKLSEIARYWAAKELTTLNRTDRSVELFAPFACEGFTLSTPAQGQRIASIVQAANNRTSLQMVSRSRDLAAGRCWFDETRKRNVYCFDLPRGASRLDFSSVE